VTPERPRDRTQRRREITWFLGTVFAIAALLLAAPLWAGLLDHVQLLTATVAAVAIGAALLASRRRSGLGWTVVRVLCVAAIVMAVAMASLVAVCIPSGCFN